MTIHNFVAFVFIFITCPSNWTIILFNLLWKSPLHVQRAFSVFP